MHDRFPIAKDKFDNLEACRAVSSGRRGFRPFPLKIKQGDQARLVRNMPNPTKDDDPLLRKNCHKT